MSRFRRLFPDAEEHPQNPTQQTGRLPNHDLHSSYLLSFRQTIPQAISRNDTRNISTPTGVHRCPEISRSRLRVSCDVPPSPFRFYGSICREGRA